MHPLVDIGANLTSKSFRTDLPAVIARAAAAGVRTLVVTGTSLEVSGRAADMVAAPAGAALFATAGVHPHNAKEAPAAGWTSREGGHSGGRRRERG